jgi:hypothetical protein
MKSTTLALALSVLANAENFGPEPSCVIPCISAGVSAAGCAPSDVGCQCGPAQAKISPVVAACVVTACPASLIPEIASIGYSLCAQYSAGLTASMSPTGSIMNPSGPLSTVSTMWNGTSATAPLAGGTGKTSVVPPTVAPSSTSTSASTAAAAANAAVNGMGGLVALFLGAVVAL